jgi:hypothetical protein
LGSGKSWTLFDSPTRLPGYREKGVFLRPVDIEVLVHKNDPVLHNCCALFFQHENELKCTDNVEGVIGLKKEYAFVVVMHNLILESCLDKLVHLYNAN